MSGDDNPVPERVIPPLALKSLVSVRAMEGDGLDPQVLRECRELNSQFGIFQ
jgi:hypothetical protein